MNRNNYRTLYPFENQSIELKNNQLNQILNARAVIQQLLAISTSTNPHWPSFLEPGM
jgi:hypothetical protein